MPESKTPFDLACEEWQEIYEEVPALNDAELRVARHFFRWGIMAVQDKLREQQDPIGSMIASGWAGAGEVDG